MPPPTQGRSSAQQPADEAYISSLVMAICLYGAVSRQVVIIGGGIVGAALAAYLCEHEGVDVTVIERGPNNRLVGSTGLAPGFVGLLGETPVMTGLARASADCYERLEHDSLSGFDRVGGLEVASTPAGMADLKRRAAPAPTSSSTPRSLPSTCGVTKSVRSGSVRRRSLPTTSSSPAGSGDLRWPRSPAGSWR